MCKRERCVYCNKLIIKRSKEHIIQNAIGGLEESENICCDKCNNYISKYIDAPFTNIFNPIVSRIKDFAKTNNTKSNPICTGKAKYGDEIYNVKIKNQKVVSCPELSKKMRCDISKLNFEIISYDFNINNDDLKNGIEKIAFNFALHNGIDIKVLRKGVEIIKNDEEIKNISFKFKMIPFIPLNPIDEYLELRTNMKLYHNLLLFSKNNMLWCYVDLFNTFQYYVLLSDEWDYNTYILETYFQLLQKLDRTCPKLDIRKIKDIHIYAMEYDVKPNIEVESFEKNVKTAIQKRSLKQNMIDIISSKFGRDYFDSNISQKQRTKNIVLMMLIRLVFF